MGTAATSLRRTARHAARRALDTILPPRCLGCGAVIDRQGALCPTCWSGIDFLSAPLCAVCGLPFEVDVGPDALCGACLREPPPFDRARAVMRYSDASRRLVLGFKHGDRTEGAAAYGAWLARAGAELIADTDMIVPVPLHRWRLFLRRYNQAALLAHALGRAKGVTVVPDLLVRHRRTRVQKNLSPEARRRNVAGAFSLHRAWRGRLDGQRVLLVDDVLTTGATVSACAKALRRGGAAAVDVLVLARVVRAGA